MNYILKLLNFFKNNQSLIIKFSNILPFKLDTKITVNTDNLYTLKYKDYQHLVSIIKNTISNNYKLDNTLNLWEVSFYYHLMVRISTSLPIDGSQYKNLIYSFKKIIKGVTNINIMNANKKYKDNLGKDSPYY
jgi:hypothetical protein